jgi:hypothetical protein
MADHKRYRKTNSGKYQHRCIYETNHGPIPDGWHVHHIDHNPKNNSVENLIAMPERIHTMLHRTIVDKRRGLKMTRQETEGWLKRMRNTVPSLFSQEAGGEINSQKTNCPKGHPYSEANTLVRRPKDRSPFRVCLTCKRELRRRYQNRF